MSPRELSQTLKAWVGTLPNTNAGVDSWLICMDTILFSTSNRDATDWEFGRNSVLDDSGDFSIDADGGLVFGALIKSNYSTNNAFLLIQDSTSSITFSSDALDCVDVGTVLVYVTAPTDATEANSTYGTWCDPTGVPMTLGINVAIDSVTSGDTAPTAGETDALVVYRSTVEAIQY